MSLRSPEYWRARTEGRGPAPTTCGMKTLAQRCWVFPICMTRGRKRLSDLRTGSEFRLRDGRTISLSRVACSWAGQGSWLLMTGIEGVTSRPVRKIVL